MLRPLILGLALLCATASGGGGGPALTPLSPAYAPDDMQCYSEAGARSFSGTEDYAIRQQGWQWVKRVSVVYAAGQARKIDLPTDPAYYYELSVRADATPALLGVAVANPQGSIITKSEGSMSYAQVNWNASEPSTYAVAIGYADASIPSMCLYIALYRKLK